MVVESGSDKFVSSSGYGDSTMTMMRRMASDVIDRKAVNE
jgi:hypothetical protein